MTRAASLLLLALAACAPRYDPPADIRIRAVCVYPHGEGDPRWASLPRCADWEIPRP